MPLSPCPTRGWPASGVSAAQPVPDDNARNQGLPAPSGRHAPPTARAACGPPSLSAPRRGVSALRLARPTPARAPTAA
eukprot:3464713-Pleurochrysis_carterae.AAC.1